MARQLKGTTLSSVEPFMTLDQLLDFSGFETKAAPKDDGFDFAYDGVEGIDQSLFEIIRRNSRLPELDISNKADLASQWKVSTMEQFEQSVQLSEAELALSSAGVYKSRSAELSGLKKSASTESLSHFFDFSDCAENVGIDNIMLGDTGYFDPLIGGRSLLDSSNTIMSPLRNNSLKRAGRANFTPKPFDTLATGCTEFDFSYLRMLLSSSPNKLGGPITLLPTPPINAIPVSSLLQTPTIPVNTLPPVNTVPIQIPATVKASDKLAENKTTKSANSRKRTRKENDSCLEKSSKSEESNPPPKSSDPKPPRKRRYTRKNKANEKKSAEIFAEPSNPLPESVHNNDSFDNYPPFCPPGPAYRPISSMATYPPYPSAASEYRAAYPPSPHPGSGFPHNMSMSSCDGAGNDNRNAYTPVGLDYSRNSSYAGPGPHNRVPYMSGPPACQNFAGNPNGRGAASESRTAIRNNLLASMNGRAAAAAAAVTGAGVGGGAMRTHIYNPDAARPPAYPYTVPTGERRLSNASSNTTTSTNGSGLRRLAPRPIAPRPTFFNYQ